MDLPTDSLVLQADFSLFSASGDELLKWHLAPLSLHIEDSVHYTLDTGTTIYKLHLSTKKETFKPSSVFDILPLPE